MKFYALLGYTRPHPFPVDRDAVGNPAPSDALAGTAVPIPPPKLYPGLLPESLHHATLWVLFCMVVMPLSPMHHHPMYRAWHMLLWTVPTRTVFTV